LIPVVPRFILCKSFMAKLFIGIALALSLVAAGFGFLAKGNIDKLKTTLDGKKQEVTTACC